MNQILLAEPLVPLPESDRLAQLIAKHGERIFGKTIATHGVPLYTDARHYAKAGIPTVLYGCGPGRSKRLARTGRTSTSSSTTSNGRPM